MKNNKKTLKNGHYRVMLKNIYVEIFDDNDDMNFIFCYILFNTYDYKIYNIQHKVINNVNNPACRDFFDFIEHNNIDYEEYEDLNGMIFDCNIKVIEINGKPKIYFKNKKLVARPVATNYQ
ncbi:MAG: hypothetical protein IJY73_04740 [Oscillospiraceae bacterium]|nr:hypothetical protein [Oscillospiraceae bacterium]